MRPATMSRSPLRHRLDRRRDGEAGASAVEYALLVAGIAAVIVVIVFALGTVLNKSVTKSCDHIKSTLNANSDTCLQSSP
jgi:pilus assembly protein Flp/PilA